jgi:hypothetical protein
MKTQRAIICLLIGIVLSVSLDTIGIAAEDTWAKKSDMPTARYCFGTSHGYLDDKNGNAKCKEIPRRGCGKWEDIHHRR